MNKVYSKPEIMFESFVSSTSIAADCDKIVGNPSKGTCGIEGSSGNILFSGSVSGCNFDWAGLKGDDYDGFCYHMPTEDTSLFNS